MRRPKHTERQIMDFRLSDDQIEWRDYCRKFAREEIRPVAAQHDREETVPYEVIKKAYEWKLAGLDFIQAIQGDNDGLKGVMYAEELHWGCAGIALSISASTLCAAGIASSGTPEQIARWIPEVFGTADAPKMGAYAVTEPQAGSDVKSLRTTAKRDGDDWILNGTKTFISNGGIADATVVVATVDPELGHRGQASFVVSGDNPGLKLGHKESKLGIRASQTAEIILEDCRIPGDCLLGGDEKLQKKLERARSGQRSKASGALATFEITRPQVGASAIGIAQAAYEWTLEYLAGRTEEGTPMLEQQRIQQVLADVATEIEASRLLIWRAAWMGRNGVPMTGGQGSMSKLKGGDVTMWATTTLMDLVGEYAQSEDCPLEKWFRDAKIYQIFEGTAQIQRLVVARMQVADYAERLGYAKEIADRATQAPGANGTSSSSSSTAGTGEKAALDAAATAVA
jgi:alkylation response protein AidB-like acyl-CoA dehydrogenase